MMQLGTILFFVAATAIVAAFLVFATRSRPRHIAMDIGFIAIALFLGWLEFNSITWFIRDTISKEWPPTQGVIMRHQECFPIHECGVTYAYEVDGKQYESNRIAFTQAHLPKGWSREEHANWAQREFPLGKSVTVHYDPRKPGEAALQVGVLPDDYLWTIILMAVLAIGLVIVGAWGLVTGYRVRRPLDARS